jgi:hypothetical protein
MGRSSIGIAGVLAGGTVAALSGQQTGGGHEPAAFRKGHDMRTSSFIGSALIAAVVFAAGCGNDDEPQETYSGCEDSVSALSSIDAVSELLGWSADDLLGWADGGFTVTAAWSTDSSILTQSPQGGETELVVTIAYDGGEIREIDSQPVEGEHELAMDCQPRLEVEVIITVATADGAFDETWSAVLSRSVSYQTDDEQPLMLRAEFDPAGLAGSFEIESISGPAPDSVTAVFNTTASQWLDGSIDILVEQSEGEGDDGTVSLAGHTALSWDEDR